MPKNLLLLFSLTIWAACSPVVESSKEFAEEGSFNAKNTIEYLDRIIKHDPDNAQALYQRARLELEASFTLKAKDDIVLALEEEPMNVDYLILKAKIDHKLEQYSEAVKTIEQLESSSLDFNTVENNLFVSDLFFKYGNLSKSAYFLQKAIADAPNLQDVKFQRARYYAATKDTLKAMFYYNEILHKDSTDENALLGISDIYLIQHQPDSALKWLSKKHESKKYIYDVLVARALSQKEQKDSASKRWEMALLKSPRLAEAHFHLAEYKYKKGLYPIAKSHLASIPENERHKFKMFDLLYAKTCTMLHDSTMAAFYYHKVYLQDSTLLRKKKPRQPIQADSAK